LSSSEIIFLSNLSLSKFNFLLKYRKSTRAYSGQKIASLEYFSKKYPRARSFIITLEKRKEGKEKVSVIYPWEISKIIGEKR